MAKYLQESKDISGLREAVSLHAEHSSKGEL